MENVPTSTDPNEVTVLRRGTTPNGETPSGRRAVLAVDVGATKLAVGLVTSSGQALREMRSPNPGNAPAALESLVSMSAALLDRDPEVAGNLAGIGIACGGPLDIANGLVLSPPNLPDWDKVPLTQLFNELFGLPTYLDNDATAGALASYYWDNPGKVENLVYVTVSSGIGSGVILGGAPIGDRNGNGAELGHIPLIYDGRSCTCGLRGCAEAYVSGLSISRRFNEQSRMLLPEVPQSVMQEHETLTSAEIAARASRGEPRALAHWLESMSMLRRLLRAALDLYGPELLVVGGGVTEAPRELLAPALDIQTDGPLLSYLDRNAPEVRSTGFGRDSGVISAGAVAWRRLAGHPPSMAN
ncbi:glucokinase [Ruaniaceae bacterium KH17]|nr:glucokinase [Ruaniaceae bacterium KH17]